MEMTSEKPEMTETEPEAVAEVIPYGSLEVKPETETVEEATDIELKEAKPEAEAEIIQIETMEVKLEAEVVKVPTDIETKEPLEVKPESVEMTDEQQMTEEEPGRVAEVIPDETVEAKPDTRVLEEATDTETSQPEAVVFQNLETTLDVAETEEVTFEPEMIEAESVDMTAEVEITEAEPDAGKKTKMRRFGDKMKTILKLKSSKLDLLSNAQKTNYRILPPLRKVHQTPRIRVVRFYTETTLLLCRIGVDCASFDFAQNNSMDHDKELDTLEEVLADTAFEDNTNNLPICVVNPVDQQHNIKRKKSNHRILPPLRKLRQTPRIRVVRFYTETASGFRIGVDCVSFDLA
eukprot:03302.XXX_129335_128205_1 [CDS] Oithona nana genome sequencing.